MSNQPSRLQYLLQQYADNSCTRGELIELLQVLKQDGNTPELHNVLIKIEEELSDAERLIGLDREQIFNNVIRNGKVRQMPAKVANRYRLAAAAAVLLFLGFGIYLHRQTDKPVQVTKTHATSVIVPGASKAVLTLANGKKVSLDNSTSGQISSNGKTTTIRLDQGQLAYSGDVGKTAGSSSAYNTLSTPAGGQYQLILPDGTKVWLNAASSLRFPTTFEVNKRHVELTGEGYFEVAKNKAKPFTIAVNGEEIKVLGTHFNIMGYADEASTNTTLLEGSVQITRGKEVKKLIPGEQAVVNSSIQVVRVDVGESVEWKNGNFNFSHEKIESIMRKLARWYNVEVAYQGKVTNEGFVGTVQRSKNLTEVLHVLESTGLVHFKIEERRVIVMP